LTQSQPPITRTTHTLPFDRLSPRDLERLCLWLVEREGYQRAGHLGAAGSERGRDIGGLCDGGCDGRRRIPAAPDELTFLPNRV